MGDYLSLDEAKRWTGIPVSDAQTADLEDAISAVERSIENFCRRKFTLTSSEERDFVALDSAVLRLGAFNDLVSVTTVSTDPTGDGTFDTTVTDYELESRNRIGPETRPYERVRRINGTWPVATAANQRQARVRIEGTWGWPAVPSVVKQAARIQVSRIFNRTNSPYGVAGSSEFGMMRLMARLDPDVEQLLAPYRIVDGFA